MIMKKLEDLNVLKQLLVDFDLMTPELKRQIAIKEEELRTLASLLKKYKMPIENSLLFNVKEEPFEASEENKDEKSPVKNVSEPKLATRNKAKRLRVIKSDGSIIERERAAETLEEAIVEAGIQRVYELYIPLDGYFLVDTRIVPKYSGQQRKSLCGFWINMHSNTLTKKSQLEKISSALGLNWHVEIIEQGTIDSSKNVGGSTVKTESVFREASVTARFEEENEEEPEELSETSGPDESEVEILNAIEKGDEFVYYIEHPLSDAELERVLRVFHKYEDSSKRFDFAFRDASIWNKVSGQDLLQMSDCIKRLGCRLMIDGKDFIKQWYHNK